MNQTPQSPSALRWIKLCAPVVLVLIGVSLVANGFDSARLEGMVTDLGRAAPIVFVVMAVVLMSVMVPKTVMSVAAGAMFGTVMGSGLMLLIAVVAASINFFIGRWWLADTIDRRIKAESQTGEILQLARSMAGEAGFGFHFLLRLTPVPTMVISYLMGACGGRYWPFLAAAAAGVIPQTLWVHSGSAVTMVGDSQSDQLRWFSIALSVIGAIAVSVIVPRRAVQRLKQTRQDQLGIID
ncbi:TVP38/TMEM64 family protein [Rubripirellula reticaptiva]|uniref:TVP38/TMEM64 family protein n=1 Tax=Rubripirellula reticaptiva TaxID=2528013 RepID=UPI001647BFAA|nr:VTT domain-containing protein [Rubripirellula reticaptiva]